jgi:6-phosphofructokinase 1
MLCRVTTLGEPRYPSPLRRFVSDDLFVPEHFIRGLPAPQQEWGFELAGPRAKLFLDPMRTRAGIVTCGGLCLGLNNVIRSLFNELTTLAACKRCSVFVAAIQDSIRRAAKRRSG